MGFAWQDSATVLGGLLRRRGQDPGGVTSSAEAWAAFEEFLQDDIDGICRPVDQYDSDSFFVHWNRQCLTLRRQIAIAGKPEDMADEFWQPEYWVVDLELVYGDGEDLFDEYDADTGFYCFDNAEDLRTGHADLRGTCQPLRMALGRTPVSSSLTFECVR